MDKFKYEKMPGWTWGAPLCLAFISLMVFGIGGFILMIGSLFFSVVGYKVMERKNRDKQIGWFVGFFTGAVGVLVLIFIPKKKVD